MKKVTRAWKVYGADGHRQKVSFEPSIVYDFTWNNYGFSEKGKTRVIELINSDKTGTNEYAIIKITTTTPEDCERELNGQLWDGIFENVRVGDVEEIELPEETELQ